MSRREGWTVAKFALICGVAGPTIVTAIYPFVLSLPDRPGWVISRTYRTYMPRFWVFMLILEPRSSPAPQAI